MGSYSAPGFIVYIDRSTVDLTYSVDQIVIEFESLDFSGMLRSSVGFDGQVIAEFQRSDDSWASLEQIFAVASRTRNFGIFSASIQEETAPYAKYPYVIRVRVANPPSLGTCVVYTRYYPRPPNPLF